MLGKYLLFYRRFVPHEIRHIDTRVVYRVTRTEKTRLCLEVAHGEVPKPNRYTVIGDHIAVSSDSLEEIKGVMKFVEAFRQEHQRREERAWQELAKLLESSGKA